MRTRGRVLCWLPAIVGAMMAAAAPAQDDSRFTYTPLPYQEGKDVVWVPTPSPLVEKMLDMARLTPQDVVIDLGSGDGRNVIAAARRGARAHGIEFEAGLVELSRRNAATAGISDRATFAEGDMFEADLSQATVLPLFLLEENLARLVPKFMQLRPGTRIVNNSFRIAGWEPDETGTAGGGCERYCTAYLYIVPARVAGTWRLGGGELVLDQRFQMLSGTFTSQGRLVPVLDGRLDGDAISFRLGDVRYSGRVAGEAMSGEIRGAASRPWTATKATGPTQRAR